jgi:hypothetical protein
MTSAECVQNRPGRLTKAFLQIMSGGMKKMQSRLVPEIANLGKHSKDRPETKSRGKREGPGTRQALGLAIIQGRRADDHFFSPRKNENENPQVLHLSDLTGKENHIRHPIPP